MDLWPFRHSESARVHRLQAELIDADEHVAAQDRTIRDLSGRLKLLSAENAELRERIGPEAVPRMPSGAWGG